MLAISNGSDVTNLEAIECGDSFMYWYTLPNGWGIEISRTKLVTQKFISDTVYEIDVISERLAEFEVEHECSCGGITSVTVNGQVYRVSHP
jgi:hypothetical protein